MTTRAPARPGDPLADVDTPALLLDLRTFEANVAAMQAWCDGQGVTVRPHAKSHKCAAIAAYQMGRGAVGVCAQKVSEAEALVHAGVSDVLVSNQIVGVAKARRLAALAKLATIGVCVDHSVQIEQLSTAAALFDVTLNVLVEIEVGQGRCGVLPGAPALALAKQVDAAPGLQLAGLQAYHGGAQHFREPDARRAAVDHAAQAVRQTTALLAEAGLDAPTIAGAGTGTFYLEGAAALWTEVQPGSYAFMDADYARNTAAPGDHPQGQHALFMHTTVMSRAKDGLAVLDAGHKALPIDSGMPLVWGDGSVRYSGPTDEHGCLRPANSGDAPVPSLSAANASPLATNALPELGDNVLLVPAHCDPTVNQHDWIVVMDDLHGPNPRVVQVWPVTARGCYA